MKKLFLLLFLLVGCQTPNHTEMGKVMPIIARAFSGEVSMGGSSAIVGPNEVLTVEHVTRIQDYPTELFISKSLYLFNVDVKLKIEKTWPGSREKIVLLSNNSILGWGESDIWEIASDYNDPKWVVTPRGTFLWSQYRAEKGDSGSPVADSSGRLIGLVWGFYTDNRQPIYMSVVGIDINE